MHCYLLGRFIFSYTVLQPHWYKVNNFNSVDCFIRTSLHFGLCSHKDPEVKLCQCILQQHQQQHVSTFLFHSLSCSNRKRLWNTCLVVQILSGHLNSNISQAQLHSWCCVLIKRFFNWIQGNYCFPLLLIIQFTCPWPLWISFVLLLTLNMWIS